MEKNGECCRVEANMINYAVTTLENLKEVFRVTLGSPKDLSCQPAKVASDCVMQSDQQCNAYPFHGTKMASNAIQTFCANEDQLKSNNRSDKNVVVLRPGEVGLQSDKAIFHLGQYENKPVSVAENGRPTGPMYYNMHLPNESAWPSKSEKEHQQQSAIARLQEQRRRVIRIMPKMPASAEPSVGPVTGLPINDNEDVFGLQLNKQYGRQNRKARFQIEVRLPKKMTGLQDINTQYSETDVTTVAEPEEENENKRNKKNKKNKKMGAKKGKK